jgi:hypothetical protein
LEAVLHKTRAFVLLCAAVSGLALLVPRPATAAWPADPAVNVPACTAADDQDYSASVPDGGAPGGGGSGVIITWVDYRSGNGDIYAQRISADGTVQWAANGVAICTAAGDQRSPVIVPDGVGGAIIIWQDGRNGTYDIYARRITATGIVQWGANGVALCTASGNQWHPAGISDGAVPGDSGSGAIVVWQDQRGGSSNDDLYAQRILARGTVQWTANGVALCTATGPQGSISLAPGGVAPAVGGTGAIVAWDDYRSGSDFDIYAQKLSAAGAVQWTADGAALCTATGGQYSPTLVADGAAGAIVTWFDSRSGNYDIYAQRVLAGGGVLWTAQGVALCADPGQQYYPTLVSDGAAGAIVTWFDSRSGGYDIYAQRISATGTAPWTANGVALCTAAGTQWYPAIVSDSHGGAIVTWTDSRSATYDIYAQRISAGGATQWTVGGVALCSAAGWQELGTVVADGAGGAIATWTDGRGNDIDLYAQRVRANGSLGSTVAVPQGPAPAFALEPVHPNPARGGELTVRFTLASPAAASLGLFDVAGRRVAAREVGSLGAGPHALDLGEGRHLAPGLYLVCLRQGTDTRVTRVAVLR